MVNRDEVIAYLLHQMPEQDRLDFAERWFSDPEFSEHMSMVEAELLDAYVRGELPRRQRASVERFLSNSETQKRKIEFAAALRGVFPPRQRRRSSWLAAAAAVLFAGLLGFTLWNVAQNRELRSQVATLRQNAPPVTGEVYSAALAGGNLRGAEPQQAVRLPQSANVLRLDLDSSELDRNSTYRATLSNTNRLVWREEPVRSEIRGKAAVLTMWIPAEVLAEGKYTVTLETQGNPVAYYDLNIIRPLQ